MEAAQIVQRIGVTLGHSLLSQARKPIEVRYETAEDVDMNYVLCSAFYLHMVDLRNLVNMPLDLWISVVYTLDEKGSQNLGFAVTHDKIAPCEMTLYPIGSIDHATEVVKRFFAFSLLPYFDLKELVKEADLKYLAGKYGNADAWGDTITLNFRAEDFPYDVDYAGGVFRGFSNRMMKNMIEDVQYAFHTTDELKHRVYSTGNNINVVFIPASTYAASKSVPRDL